MWIILNPMTAQPFMAMFKTLSLSILLRHVTRKSWFELWWTVTMLGMSLTDVTERATQSMCKMPWFIGSPRSKLLLRKIYLDPNLSPWYTELKHCIGSVIRSTLWVFKLMILLTSLETISLLFWTHPDLNPNWEINLIVFVTMPYEKRLLWANAWPHTSLLYWILRTY